MSSEWRSMPISTLYEGLYDGPHATPKPSDKGPIFLGIKNVTEDGRLDLSDIRHIAEEDFSKWTRRVEPRSGDLVFTYEATLNRYAIIPDGFRGCLGRRMALIRPDPKKMDRRYLLYYFFTDEWRAIIKNNMLNGATVDRIPLTNFPQFPVRIPPLPIQRRIADILSAYDDLIENNKRRIKILEDMARSLYREWFVEFRFPGHESAKFVDSPLGKIPEGWKVSTLGAQSSVVMGQSPKSEFYNDKGNGLPFHQGVTHYGSHFPNHVLFCSMLSRIAEAGDTLVSVRAPVGRINIADTRIVIGRGLAAVRPIHQYPRFHYWQLREVFREEDAMGGGTIFKAITKGDLLAISWLVPNHQIVNKFEECESPIFELLRNLTLKAQNLIRTRDLLLPRLLSGQLDVSTVKQEERI